ncbi:MAG: LysM peptidoglycan-binding domain-containing protein [Lysobacterales bacterium]|nr:MAG: LysM peptidoglycan-binding domain-containing protein [Xanthomonadales bacterium]
MTLRRAALLPWLLAVVLQACGPSWSPVEKDPGSSSYAMTSDGHYRVRRGDSLHAIAFKYGLDWRALAEWNDIREPYTIYPDQQLRLSPPGAQPSTQVVTRPAPEPARAVSREGPASGEDSVVDGSPDDQDSPGTTAGPALAESPPPVRDTPPAGDPQPANTPATPAEPLPLTDPERWLWPAEGRLLSRFHADDPARKGIQIGGDEGQPVMATAAGEVVYSGSGLIGFGELIIVKHSDRMLSAYAHNRRRLVVEGQRVAAGEQLAEMGRNDRNQPMLHFEIRVNGAPQDPLKYLPGRQAP